jgi:TonB family protein
MKTKQSPLVTAGLRLLKILPLIALVLFAFSSCAAKKKAAGTQTEVAPPPPPPPPPAEVEPEPYVVVEQMPMYPGGDSELLKYIAMNTQYPKNAKANNIQGRVIVKFCVTAEGGVNRVSIERGVDPELDAEAIRVVSTLKSFQPGQQGGKAVPVWYMIPITFTLNSGNMQRPSRYEVVGNDTIYLYTREMPQFLGGYEAQKKFQAENLKYSPELKNLGIEGTVMVKFYVDKEGSISNVKVLNGVSQSLDAEAIRVTKLMPNWLPGKEKGKPVKFVVTTGYDFLLTPRVPPVIEEGTPFVVVEEMPMFPGGDSALLAYISQNTKYPATAKANGIEGRVIVRFCVTDVGGVDRVSVLRGVDPELDAEAIRVVKSLPTFKPGKQGGKPVNVWYMVPITFSLGKPSEQLAAKTPVSQAPALPPGYDETPVFKGGEAAMMKFINSKLVYPNSAKENKISGKIDVRFSIDTDGSVSGVSIWKGIDPELDAEAIRVVKLMPAWTPAKLDGKPVKVWYSAPVTFTLK